MWIWQIGLDDYRAAELIGGDPDVWDPVCDDYQDPGPQIAYGHCLMGTDSHQRTPILGACARRGGLNTAPTW